MPSSANNTVFLSFSNKKWNNDSHPLDRIGKEAESFGIFDKILLLNEDSFERWYVDKYSSIFNEKSFGYWQWKSYIIKTVLDGLEESDVLLYCDAGCHLNIRGRKRMLEYIKIVSDSSSGVLLFEQCLKENIWTKGDVFEFFKIDPATYTKNQCCGGIIFLRKCPNALCLINDWFKICHEFHYLITDEASKYPNYRLFRENRHDQSVISLLAHNKYHSEFISADETYADNDWNKLWKYPIWACRNQVKEAKRNALRNHYNPMRILKARIKILKKSIKRIICA